ncbi:MAG: sodium/proline symporter [Gammaproteobacteria bacterium]|jgi:sodium/proline symporter|nr:sodium/proline symporter [Gammaproteobacteria bacterium]MDP6731333.1 sodium/proline symporter [Gammaproteobacteria bacterium]
MFESYFMIVLYFSVLMFLGYLASRRVHSMNDFVIGGKSLSFWVAAFSAQATGESAWLLLGLTGMGAMVGFSAYWVVVGEFLGVAAAWFLMATRFKRLTDKYDSMTVIDYMVSRFKSKSHLLRVLSALVLSIFVMIYISAQIDATGSAFETFLNWDYLTGAIVGFLIVAIYCIAGGFLAAAWTDMFQGAVMLICLMLLPLVAFLSLSNAGSIYEGLRAIEPGLVSMWGSGGFNLMNLSVVIGMGLIGLGFLGSPQVFARLIAIRSESQINRGKWAAILFTILVDFSAVSIGVLGRYIFTTAGVEPDAVLGNGAQNVLSELVEYTFPPWIVGLYVAAVLSAIMSTVSSLLVMAAGSITHDLYEKIYNPKLTDSDAARMCQRITLVLAACSLGVAIVVSILSPDRTIFWFVIFGWAGIAATFCPMIILSLFWPRFTERAAIASMLTGFFMTIISKFVLQTLDGIGPYFVALETMPPSFLSALIVGYLVTIMWPDEELEASYRQDLVHIEQQDLELPSNTVSNT